MPSFLLRFCVFLSSALISRILYRLLHALPPGAAEACPDTPFHRGDEGQFVRIVIKADHAAADLGCGIQTHIFNKILLQAGDLGIGLQADGLGQRAAGDKNQKYQQGCFHKRKGEPAGGGLPSSIGYLSRIAFWVLTLSLVTMRKRYIPEETGLPWSSRPSQLSW